MMSLANVGRRIELEFDLRSVQICNYNTSAIILIYILLVITRSLFFSLSYGSLKIRVEPGKRQRIGSQFLGNWQIGKRCSIFINVQQTFLVLDNSNNCGQIHFNFDFLDLDKLDFENYNANERTK